MAIRPRIFDLFAVVGITLLLLGIPAYVAQEEDAHDLADGRVFETRQVRVGTTAAFEMVFAFDGGDPVSVGPLRSATFREVRPGEMPFEASFVYEVEDHAVHATFPWGTFSREASVQRTWYDAEGWPVWMQRVRPEGVPDENGTLRIEDRLVRLDDDNPHGPESAFTDSIVYHPASAVRLRTELVEGLLSIVREVTTGTFQTRAETSDVAAQHNDILLFQVTRPEIERMLWPNDEPCPTCNGTSPAMWGVDFDPTVAPPKWRSVQDSQWWNPDWPFALGNSYRYVDDVEKRVFLRQSLLPMHLSPGAGPVVTLKERPVPGTVALTEHPVQQIPLGGLMADPRPLHGTIKGSDLMAAVLSDAAPADVRGFARSAAIVEFYGLQGTPYLEPVPDPLRLPVGLPDVPVDIPPLENRPSQWFLTLAQRDGSVRIVEVGLVERQDGIHVEEVLEMCERARRGVQTDCSPVDPALVDPQRRVGDPWALRARATDLLQERDPDDTWRIDRFAFLPLYRHEVWYDGSYHGATNGGIITSDISRGSWMSTHDRMREPWTGRALLGATNEDEGSFSMAYDLEHGALKQSQHVTTGSADAPVSPLSAGASPVAIDVVGATAIKGGVFLVTVSVLARGFAWLKAGGGIPVVAALYAKIRKADVLLNARREDIVELVRAEPGIHPSGIARRLGYGWGAAVHHLETLVRNRVLAVIAVGGTRHYFLAGTVDARSQALVAARRDENAARFLDALAAHPAATVSELAAVLDRSVPGVSRTGSRLAREGLVVKRRDGMSVRFWPALDGVAGDDAASRETAAVQEGPGVHG